MLTSITKLQYQHLQNAEAVHFSKMIIERVVSANPLPAPVQTKRDAFASVTGRMDLLIQQARHSRFTDALQSEDAVRDERTQSFYLLCEGFSKCEDDRRRTAGRLLLDALRPYGTASDLRDADYDKQTQLLNGLVRDLQGRPDLHAALVTCGLESLVEALKFSNEAFANLQRQSIDEDVNKPEAFEMVTLRREARKAYRELIEQIQSAYNFTGGSEPWLGMVAAINQIVEDYKLKLAQRAGRNAAKAEEKSTEA
ncbi:hypothetical protein EPD60_06620 [Flaviaesturariibacter flavus]|uniref:Uncharacterized protein n=1 Tax=Flaviaesturariibacter flavus TaxID=2502780 RepID=A0A4R1BKI6_9BACT|nr:DUF6261 family protein [Flaviaesturariibacter flavus]TCJ17853.1 hypothetical protein EPD60_06620 [Flaviaesturariibacter flavus]